jgi:glucose/arabinose dehydrogenase
MKRLLQRYTSILLLSLLLSTAGNAQWYHLDTLALSPAVSSPSAIGFVPGTSGRFFFTERTTGRIRVFRQNMLQPKPFASVAVASSGEEGLLGLAVHPEYPDSPYVYVYYTRSGDRANTIVRFRDSLDVGVRPRTLLLIPRTDAATSNNGGDIHFGPDGKLYVSVGDYGIASNAQDTSASNLRGKILRLNSDGSIPEDNPWQGKPFWSVGHRNTLGLAFDEVSGKLYCTENGTGCNNEVNVVPRGGNLGWPGQDNCVSLNSPFYTRPLYFFPEPARPFLTGILVYRGSAFPHLRGKLLIGGNSVPMIWQMTLSAEGDTIAPGSTSALYASNIGVTSMAVGPDGCIYFTGGQSISGRILRLRPIVPAFSSTPPTAATQDIEYTYSPTFSGTPPSVSLESGPDGMSMDTTTWSIRWTPTNAQALQRTHPVVLRAVNGDGSAVQSYTIAVTNVNDPPLPFGLLSPPNDTTLVFVNAEPLFQCSWEEAQDPDLDTLTYTFQCDTVDTFNSPSLITTVVRIATSHTTILPKRSGTYYWRVVASDGETRVHSMTVRSFVVAFATKARIVEQFESTPALEQNFPNPFNPSTNIKYSIPKGGHVRLAVYNMLGQQVAIVFEGDQAAGSYEMEFQSADLPTGIYFYRIQAPDFVETKKMVITR